MLDVRNMKDLVRISYNFDSYPLQSTKLIHYQLWCQVMDMITVKQYTTISG